jgi:hypothetical protein
MTDAILLIIDKKGTGAHKYKALSQNKLTDLLHVLSELRNAIN